MARLVCLFAVGAVLAAIHPAPPLPAAVGPSGEDLVSCASLKGKILCGYQGWFRCPGDGAREGWIHWSRDAKRITPKTLTFDMWPDLSEFPPAERFAAPGFTHKDGSQAFLFSSDNAATVLRHFRWMREYGIDGVWLQHFLVDLPGGPLQQRHPSRVRVLQHVRRAAKKTGRAWALTYDLSGMPVERIFDVLTRDWKKMIDGGIGEDSRYLHDGGKPVVQLWGFYPNDKANPMTPALANKLIDFFKAPGRYSAFLVGGGDWNWRSNRDREWQKFFRRFDAYAPWNVGNYRKDEAGELHASTRSWAEDLRECKRHGMRWLPVVYPGFSWDNLKGTARGASTIPRRRGRFLWEQFHELAKLEVDSVFVAMFDEVDEGTAIFKVTNSPPTQGRFADYEGLPSDWYLRLVDEGGKMLRGKRPLSKEIPIKP